MSLRMDRNFVFIALFFVLGLQSCNWLNSPKIPEPSVAPVTADYWLPSTALEELGYHLYFEKNFSADNSISCNTCHNVLNRGNGAQDTSVSTGINGLKGGRNSPTVWNAKFLSVQFWDGRAKDLAEQAKGPIVNPVEMGMKSHDLVFEKIKAMPKYKNLYEKAFPGQDQPINLDNSVKAIATFESALTTLNSPFDKGELSDSAQQGHHLFQSMGCITCHSGPHFSGPELPVGTGFYMKFPTFVHKDLEDKYAFSKDLGRYDVTRQETDRNMWRVPTLRNVAITAPYFHNGSVPDLKTAVKVMAKTQLNKDLDEKEVNLLVSFLESLTGERPLIKDPSLKD